MANILNKLEELKNKIKSAIYYAYKNGHSETPYVSSVMNEKEVCGDVDYAGIESIIATLEANLYKGEWMPIKTAPKDVLIHVFAWDVNGVISPEYTDDYPPMQAITQWHELAGFCVCELREATHWMPLANPPPPPTKEALDGN